MNSSFRSEMFNLCKLLSEEHQTSSLKKLIREMNLSREDSEGIVTPPKYGDIGQLARKYCNEFHSYLFLDDYLDNLQLPPIFHVNHLKPDDRKLIELGHGTIMQFINLCVADMPRNISAVLNPYSTFKEISMIASCNSFVAEEKMSKAALSFKNTSTYQLFMSSNIMPFFQQCDTESLNTLFQALDQSIGKSFTGECPADLQAFSQRLTMKTYTAEDTLLAYAILAFALKKSLSIASRMLFQSICGFDLLVFDNENIINLEKRCSNTICDYSRVLVQGYPLNCSSDGIGDIILIDCSLPEALSIHEFGYVVSISISFSQEAGNTSKFSFVKIDDDLNPLGNLSNQICQASLPPIVFEQSQ